MIMDQEIEKSHFQERDVVSAILWKGTDLGIKDSAVTRNKVQNWPNAEVNTKLISEASKILKKSCTVVEVASLPARANINPVGVVIKEIPHLKKTKIRPI